MGFNTRRANETSVSEVERSHRLICYAEQFEDRWFWETDADGRLTYLSPSVSEQIDMCGVATSGEIITNVFRLDQSETEHARSLQFHIVSRTAFSDYPVRGIKGLSESWWSMSGRPWFSEDGEYQGFVGSGTDLTKTRKDEATIRRLAMSDSLTSLANRQRMQDHLDALIKSGSGSDLNCALLMLDLDGFKAVNDTLGHPVGDALLIQVARRLSAVVGEIGIVGRLGGDEFQVLIPSSSDRDSLSNLASEIIEEISAPYSVESSSITISCSIGIAVSGNGSDAETLVRTADIALYAAKDGGRATYRFFEEEMLAKAKWRKELEDELRLALNSNQLSLVYQPVVSTTSGELAGFEALLRWKHPHRGYIGPSEFIPIAEESGLIQQIGSWVIRTAIHALTTLPDDLRIAVNVSAIQFSNPAFLSTLANAIGDSQIDPDRLELEITESVFLENEDKSQKTFKSLKKLGVRLALDDFGTGYSSLGYLQHTPFDKIKIDQSFVKGAIDPRNRNSAIISSVVTLARALGMETTAEGVEYQDEIELIRKLGCSHIQGYVYGPGLDLAELMQDLQSGLRKIRAIGHKHSRSRRTNQIRSAKMSVNGSDTAVRIRNLSETGALIDQAHFTDQMVGVTILIELLENEMCEAVIRWVGDQKAGVEFCNSNLLSDTIDQASSSLFARRPERRERGA